MTAIQGLIFDFDGLIVDTEDADQRAWREQFRLAGVPITEQQYADWWHHWAWNRTTRMIHRLAALVGEPVNEQAILADRLTRYNELCAGLPARPGIQQWMSDAHAMGLKLGVATNDDTHRTPGHLRRLGLDRYLDTVVVLEPGLARKPAPDLYQRALKILELDPAGVVAVEDSSHGIEAAHRAGMKVIAYPTPTVSAFTDLSAADLLVESAADISLAQALLALDEDQR